MRTRARALLVAVLVASGCGDGFFFDPAPEGGAASVHLRVDAQQLTGSPADAFDRADRITVSLVDPLTGETVFGSDETFAPAGQETRIRIELDLQGRATTLGLAVTLFRGADPLFVAGRSVTLEPGRTTEATVTLTPLPAGVVGPASLPTFTAFGDAAPLGAAVVMATGDTIPGLGVVWSSGNPQVVAVEGGAGPNPRAVAVADGATELVARFSAEVGGVPVAFEHRAPVVVRARVVLVEVDPPSVVLELSESVSFAATAHDRNGNPIPGRVASWRSLDDLIAAVDDGGLVSAVEPGETRIVATVEGVEGSAEVTVNEPDPPPPPGNPSVAYQEGVRLSWFDTSGGTAEFEVQRAVTPPPSFAAQAPEDAFVTVAVLPPGSRGYTDPAPVPGFLEYRVRACNAFACSGYTPPVGFSYHLAPNAVTDPPLIGIDGVVQFRGRVDPHGLATAYYFEWDFSSAFTEPIRTNLLPAGDHFGDVTASATDSGLPFDTQLYVRLVAENSAGTTVGNTITFIVPGS